MALTKAQKAERAEAAKKRAALDYNNAYNKANYLNYSFRVNRSTEYKYIAWLAQQPEGLKPYIFKLIDRDMKYQKRKKVIDAETDAEADS